MAEKQDASESPRLPGPLPYHWSVVRYLKTEEPDLWNWFSSSKTRGEHAEAIRLDLLKSTYRIERETQAKLYTSALEVLAKYKLDVPITFYQNQTGNGMNASLAYLPGEAHIILTGPVLSALSEAELHALLGHELAHFLLFDRWKGEFFTATELLRALTQDAGTAPPHFETARLFCLYTEVFADRGALTTGSDVAAAICTLIKMETGLMEVSAESYLRQAEEIFSKAPTHANQLTHPEPYIRARALNLWADRGEAATTDIERMIEGPRSLECMDLLGQQQVAATTRRLLQTLLAPAWFQSDAALAHARQFFHDFALNGKIEVSDLAEEFSSCTPSLKDYYSYVLLDFVAVDREVLDTSLAAALVLARRLSLGERFAELAQKELGIGKKSFAKIERDAEAIVAKANEGAAGT